MKYFTLICLISSVFAFSIKAQTHQVHLLSYTTLSLEIADVDDDGDQDFLTGGISNL